MTEKSAVSSPAGRIVSVDALRGFDMFWIIGVGDMAKQLFSISSSPVSQAVARQFDHAEWTGFHAWDLIMPLFLFIVGTSLPFSMSKRITAPSDRRRVYIRILKRFVILFLLGMAVEGNLLRFDLSHMSIYCNTLQAIACGYAVAAIVIMNMRIVWQGLVCAALLTGYWLLMALVPFGGHPAGTLTPSHNLAMYIDKAVMGHFQDGTTYTWILSSMTFAATVLLGVMSGYILKSKTLQPGRKLLGLTGAGALCLIAGLVMGIWFPIIKHIWTSSFALFSAGLCFFLLALFYWVIDIIGFKKWAFFFIVIGSNALFIYSFMGVVMSFIPKSFINTVLVANPGVQGLIFVGVLSTEWLMLYAMYRKQIFIKV
jgi:predicted acyltransferase